MPDVFNYPLAVFVLTFVLLWLATWAGSIFLSRLRDQVTAIHDDFNVVLGATLTLLGLIIGFTFSMAVTRYDQRKNLEEEEANAIGTEYLRADLLPDGPAGEIRGLLKDYLAVRIAHYHAHNDESLAQSAAKAAELQDRMWRVVRGAAAAQPTPITSLAVSGMNDVLNSQGYAQAAMWNRIPVAAWGLMTAIAVCASLLVGIGAHKARPGSGLHAVLPFIVGIAFFLIADIDSPRRGVIRVTPQNLHVLAQSLGVQ